MLDPTLFNILLNDLFFIIKDTNFANYVDHNTIYKAIINIDDVIAYYNSHLKSPSNVFKIIRWKEAPINVIS